MGNICHRSLIVTQWNMSLHFINHFNDMVRSSNGNISHATGNFVGNFRCYCAHYDVMEWKMLEKDQILNQNTLMGEIWCLLQLCLEYTVREVLQKTRILGFTRHPSSTKVLEKVLINIDLMGFPIWEPLSCNIWVNILPKKVFESAG